MIFDEMRTELKELLFLVRLDEQYCAAVMSGKAPATDVSHAQHLIRATKIAQLTEKYGLQ